MPSTPQTRAKKIRVPSVRTSERSTFKRCQQRWVWAYIDGYKPKREKNPLWFGSGIHLALAEWYQPGFDRGRPMEEVWLEYCADEERMIPQDYEEDELKYVDARDLGVEMLRNYVEQWGTDPNWEVLSTEQTFKYLVYSTDLTTQQRKLVARYLGTFDGVYRDRETGLVWLMEHKTAAAIITTHLPLDDQAGSYLFVVEDVLRKAGMMGPDEEVAGIMYNFLKKAKADNRPRNAEGLRCNKPTKAHYLAAMHGEAAMYDDFRDLTGKEKLEDLESLAEQNNFTVLGEPSKTQPPPLFIREAVWRSAGDKRSMHNRIVAEVGQMEAVRNGIITATKTPTRDCSWDCDFFRMCQLHESGDDWEEYRNQLYKIVDPYADHRNQRKSAGG